MRSFQALTSGLLAGCLAALILAILLARSSPPETAARFVRRGEPQHLAFWADGRPGSRWLDPATGELTDRDPGDDRLVARSAASSPWVDGGGHRQVVETLEVGPDGEGRPVVLLCRRANPSGEILDEVAVNVRPRGRLAWFPDLSSRLLFAADDGGLYQTTFEPADRRGEVRRLAWPSGEHAKGQTLVGPCSDVVAWGGRYWMAVTTRRHPSPNDSAEVRHRVDQVISLLEIDPEFPVVLDDRPLAVPNVDGGVDRDVDERGPALTVDPAGRLVAAFVQGRNDGLPAPRRVWVTRLDEGPTPDGPIVLTEARAFVVPEDLLPFSPVFASDGSGVWCVAGRGVGPWRLLHIRSPWAATGPLPRLGSGPGP